MAIGVTPNAQNLGISGRIVGTLFFSVFFLMGLFFEVMIVRQTATNLATYNWTKTEAVILSSDIARPRSNEHDPVLRVRYTYTFSGTRRESSHIETEKNELETDNAYRLAERYAAGAHVPCWVDPAAPDNAVLHRKSPATALIALFPLIFVSIGGIGIWAMWRRKPNLDDAEEKPISGRAKNPNPGRRVMAAFFGLFLLIGIGVGYPLFVQPLMKIAAARSWMQVPCDVISSRVRTHSNSDGNTYRVDVVYRYTYKGVTYTSNRYHFATGSSSGYGGKAEAVRNFPVGRRAVCFVDPNNPTEAVLERSATSDLWFGLIPLVFALVGAGGLTFTLRRKSDATSVFTTTKTTQASTGGAVSVPVAGGGNDNGPQTLKPAASPKVKLIGVMFAAVFWNSIVSVFLFNLISEWRRGGGFSWFLALFLTPFVLVGLGLIGGVFYQFMALFNPRPRLTVSHGVMLPGDTIDVSWELEGRADILQRLQVTLEGREEATYRRGTNTRTDKEVFATIQIADTADLVAMHSGSARLLVPPGAMHSFKSSNNKIVWALKVHGEIPRWPDIKDEYPVTIAPNPIAR